MISFYLNIRRLLKAIYHASEDPEFRALSILTFILLLSGTIFYSNAEKWNLLDSLYFCAMTMTTVGYGDLAPTSDLSKIFTIIYAFVSIGVFVSLAAKLAAAMMKSKNKS